MKYLGKKAEVLSIGGMDTDMNVGDIVNIGACDFEIDQSVAVEGRGDWGYVEGDIDRNNLHADMATVVEPNYRIIE